MFTMRRYEINIKQKKEECKIIRKFAQRRTFNNFTQKYIVVLIHLYITRHGQTEENVQRILQGQMPGHLTQTGIQQAEDLRDRLIGQPFDAIITSDLKRATDTAHIIAQGRDCPVIEEPLLRERDFGIHTGGPYISISHALDPSAETMEHVAQRAADFLNKMARERDGEQLLVVSHGLFLRVLQAVFHGVETRAIERMDNAEVRLLELDPTLPFQAVTQTEVGGTAN